MNSELLIQNSELCTENAELNQVGHIDLWLHNGRTVRIKSTRPSAAGKLGKVLSVDTRLPFPYKIKILETGQVYTFKRSAFEFEKIKENQDARASNINPQQARC